MDNEAPVIDNRTQLVHWFCPDCAYSMTGFIAPGDSLTRRCQSFYKRIGQRTVKDACLPSGQICGALMHSEEL